MIISNIPGLSSMSMVKAKVDLYNGSTLVKTCTCGDVLSDFTVTRDGDNSKFFGFGICHKLDVNLIDLNRELLSVTVGNTAEIGLGDGTIWDTPYPTFYIQELQRDEKANTIKATAYDKLYEAGEYLFEDLGLTAPYCFTDVAQAIATKLGLTLNIDTSIYSAFRLTCLEDPNLDEGSTRDLRSVLNWLAEATQSIYFVNHLNELVFKRFDKDGAAVAHITQNDYYELNTKTPKTLTAICNTTELGDNLEASVEGEGITQYIRSNPFIELREDLPTILETGIAAVGGLTITQFDCDWVGNYLLEPCDKIALATEDGTEVYSYLISDSVTYAGTLNEVSNWEYTEQGGDTFANPTNIGEKITQTFAKVDKVNKNIALLVSDVSATKESVANLTMATNAINLLVTEHEEKIEAFEELETGKIVDRMAQIEIDLDGIETTVSSNTTQIQAANTEIAGVKQTTTSNTSRISAIETNVDGINLSVSNQSSKITTLETTTQTQGTAIDGLSESVGTLTETTTDHTEQISALTLNADSIAASIKEVETKTTESYDSVAETVEKLAKEVNLKMSSEEVEIAISSSLENGIDKVTTSTGFTFDSNGLNISKSGSELVTLISEDGMTIEKSGSEVLVADNQGVRAEDLHATTYLIIGDNSRFENFGNSRTACFWIGGNN
jgi:archaellum component FlaC